MSSITKEEAKGRYNPETAQFDPVPQKLASGGVPPVTKLVGEAPSEATIPPLAPGAFHTVPSNIVPVQPPAPAAPAQPKPQLLSGGKVQAIVPTSIEEAMRLAKAVAFAGWAPKSYLKDPKNADAGYDEYKIMLGILHGMELGLTPLAALSSIAVINGAPSVWGDGALAIVLASGHVGNLTESPILNSEGVAIGYSCSAERKGVLSVFTHSFTMADAQAAGLSTKSGPWQNYPIRMCQMRARAWTLRAAFADVLRGLSIAEEVQDIPAEPAAPERAVLRPGATAKSALDDFDGKPATQKETNGHNSNS
ncbi:hypothetical protein UFOVP119_19 [uncultured Caudovirales phage]|uniref:Uncharacterized protein n=1 Tax=uncultured Caudovirales phage TaxID=2100421 RepID=A0A6J5L8Q5_9CAUD|nr:hypothetical protein UFOVP119_19 [uncultured Caudovirales phage]